MDDSCVVCLEIIKPEDPIWHCRDGCFIPVHLLCAQRAAAANLNGATKLLGQLLADSPAACWYCPHCRQPYQEYPLDSRCYCGALRNPPLDPWLAPHSCGGSCRGKRRQCEHLCLDQCHSGPHPPCTIALKQACFCGKKEETVRCGTKANSCGQICGRVGLRRLLFPDQPESQTRKLSLALCSHPCKAACHPGDCPPCGELVSAPCACGSETKRLPCAARIWKCKRACPKGLLACGRCPCPLGCHSGPCPPCPNSSVRTCGCGKESYEGLPCNAPTATCGGTCGKLLPNCEHFCQERCHAGECAKCREVVDAPCRCGKTTKRKVCSAVAETAAAGAGAGAIADDDEREAKTSLCSIKCRSLLDCKLHPCKKRCCNGSAEAHACNEVCTKKLSCGLHTCGRRCHKGTCGVCPVTVTLSCPCGGTRKISPCGKQPPMGTIIPCRLPCQRPANCTKHPKARHPCHEGLCPPCTATCGEVHPRCGHPCPLPCHSELLTAEAILAASSSTPKLLLSSDAASASFPALPQQAAASAIAAALAQAKAPTACPPCAVPTDRVCVGGHETRQLACSAPALFKCNNPCGATLQPCSKHVCTKPCHGSKGTSCGSCSEKCSEPRPEGCSHPCETSAGGGCHAGECSLCSQPVAMRCLCGRSDLKLSCHQAAPLLRHKSSLADEPLLKCSAFSKCGKPLKRCAHLCGYPGCHGGSCDDNFDCQKGVTVRCACGGKKEEWSCSRVRLQTTGLSFSSIEKKGYQLLPCKPEEGCKPAESEVAKARVEAKEEVAAPAVSAEERAAQKVEHKELKRRRKQEEEREAEASRLTAAASAEAKRKAEEEREEQLSRRRRLVLCVIVGSVLLWLLKTAFGL
jgi:NF-X1-type zinc finger protein NFXL1